MNRKDSSVIRGNVYTAGMRDEECWTLRLCREKEPHEEVTGKMEYSKDGLSWTKLGPSAFLEGLEICKMQSS